MYNVHVHCTLYTSVLGQGVIFWPIPPEHGQWQLLLLATIHVHVHVVVVCDKRWHQLVSSVFVRLVPASLEPGGLISLVVITSRGVVCMPRLSTHR